MKKKVGIMSMQRIINYGSFLQAYALYNTIKNMGHDVEFVDFKIEPCIGKPYIPTDLKTIGEKYEKSFHTQKKFNNKFKNEFLPELEIKERNERPILDTLVIGSDEVFNCLQDNPDVGYSTELFGKNHRANKIISYAACCGHTTLERLKEANKCEEISELLNKFNSISVRDKNSFDFVTNLSNADVSMHLDPVLIYDFSKDLKDIKIDLDNYIIVYAYSFNLNDEECAEIKKFAKKHNKKIVTIGSHQKCTDIFIDAHPLEVMKYFEKADFVITNTFHGTIFSIKSHVPFATRIRDNYNNEKLSYLLEKMDCMDRKISSFEDIESIYNKKMDFNKCEKIIENERKRTFEYLKNTL